MELVKGIKFQPIRTSSNKKIIKMVPNKQSTLSPRINKLIITLAIHNNKTSNFENTIYLDIKYIAFIIEQNSIININIFTLLHIG